MDLHPLEIRAVKNWAAAIAILDATEQPIRELIERELVAVAALREDKIAHAAVKAAFVKRLVSKIAKIRREAFREAFRYVRERHTPRTNQNGRA